MRWVLLLLFATSVDELIAQTPQAVNSTTPITSWEVSGIVFDSTRNSVPGATLVLKYGTDSLSTSTNEDGIFVFKGVQSATFYLTVSSLGYKPITYHLLNDDRASKIILDPVMLLPDSRMLALTTIPRYLIFNKKGTLVFDNAPAPNNPELKKILDDYINE